MHANLMRAASQGFYFQQSVVTIFRDGKEFRLGFSALVTIGHCHALTKFLVSANPGLNPSSRRGWLAIPQCQVGFFGFSGLKLPHQPCI